MTPSQDRRFMSLALALGRRRMGQTWPNPAVGCVIVRNGRIVGRGATAPGGRPHAEPQALAMAGDAARGATAYVSLEPCAHDGKTPPCAKTLISSGISQVVTACEDPDPRTAGQGHALLRDAGVEVETGVLSDQAAADHAGFFLKVREGRPWVTLKLAASFDGRIATATGESQWITGPEARRFVHATRARHDLVLVGAGTARTDDPDLGVRGFGDVPQPVRAVVSRRLNIPKNGKLAGLAKDHAVWLLSDSAEGAVKDEDRAFWMDAGAELLGAPAGSGGQIEPRAMLAALADRGITRVFSEGGGALAASLLAEGCVDELIGFTAGKALGAEGWSAVGALGVERLVDAPEFSLVETRALGGDVLHRWQRA